MCIQMTELARPDRAKAEAGLRYEFKLSLFDPGAVVVVHCQPAGYVRITRWRWKIDAICARLTNRSWPWSFAGSSENNTGFT